MKNMDMTITPQNNIEITLLKTFEFTSYVMGYYI